LIVRIFLEDIVLNSAYHRAILFATGTFYKIYSVQCDRYR